MSKKKNRCVKTLPKSVSSISGYPSQDAPPALKIEDLNGYFGEKITSPSSYSQFYEKFWNPSNGDSIDSVISGIRNLGGYSKSSSSSISWGDEYESESANKIQCELELIDRVLDGEEPVPDYYDQNEFKEWLNTFPDVRIFKKHPPSSESRTISEKSADISLSSIYTIKVDSSKEKPLGELRVPAQSHRKSILKNSARTSTENINLITYKEQLNYQKIQKKLPIRNLSSGTRNNRDNCGGLDLSDYLKVSPVFERRDLRDWKNDKDQSVKSLINSFSSSAKWLKSDSPDFNSLPFLAEELSKKNEPDRSQRRSGNFKKKSRESVVLPPITTGRMLKGNGFRSISAIPRQKSHYSSPFNSSKTQVRSNQAEKVEPALSVRSSSRIPRIYKGWDSVDG